jgi:hypothetical protein
MIGVSFLVGHGGNHLRSPGQAWRSVPAAPYASKAKRERHLSRHPGQAKREPGPDVTATKLEFV